MFNSITHQNYAYIVKEQILYSHNIIKAASQTKSFLTQIVGNFKILFQATLFHSVTQLFPTLCDPVDCSMPGFPVHHQLPELTQTHIHWVSDAIQPSYPLSPLSFPASVFSSESALCLRWPKYWSFSFSTSPSNEYSGLISLALTDCHQEGNAETSGWKSWWGMF